MESAVESGDVPARDPRTYAIIGAAMEVHRQLGRGFLEAVYFEALSVEFATQSVPFYREVAIPVRYKDVQLPVSYRADFVCFEDVVVEIKAVKELTEIEYAQVINYLKATGYQVGLLLNFASDSLEWKRFVRRTSILPSS